MTTGGEGQGGLPPAGWYPDSVNPGRERLWTGERWIEWIRPRRPGRTDEVPAGWYPDTGHPGFERLWSGEMWTEEIRRVGAASAPPPPVAAPVGVVGAVAGGGAAATGPSRPPGFGPQVPGAQFAPIPRAVVRYHDDNPPYRLGGLATWLVISFVATILSAVAQLIANQSYIGVETDIVDGRPTSLSHAESVTNGAHTTHTITLVLELITAILFVIWFYRAYRNLVRVGIADLRFSPGWAVGGWFIPIFNFFRQKAIANDIWKASSSAESVGLSRWREMPLSEVLNWWWGIWILSGLLGAFGNITITNSNSKITGSNGYETAYVTTTVYHSLRNERTGLWISQFGLVFLIAAAVLAILFVREVSRLQDDHFEAQRPGSY